MAIIIEATLKDCLDDKNGIISIGQLAQNTFKKINQLFLLCKQFDMSSHFIANELLFFTVPGMELSVPHVLRKNSVTELLLKGLRCGARGWHWRGMTFWVRNLLEELFIPQKDSMAGALGTA